MQKLLIERVRGLDVSIDESVLQRHKGDVRNNDELQRALEETGQDLEQTIRHYASFRDCGEGEEVLVREYLENHPEILGEYSTREVKRWGKSWIENTRRHTDYERKFYQQARELYGGEFGEVFQSVFILRNGQIRKYLAFSGKADGVDGEDIDKSIPTEDLKSLRAESELAVLVHNHPDFYRDSKLMEIRYGQTIGFISNGALSKRDVELADRVFDKKLSGGVPVVMLAVNENGLTHYYVAGI